MATLAERGIEDVASGDSERERVGVRELVYAGEAGYGRAVNALGSGRELPLRTKLALVNALASFDSAAAEIVLSSQQHDPHFEVRAMVAQALGGGKSPAGIDILVQLAADPTPSVRAAALRAIFAIDRDDARTARTALPLDSTPELRTRRLRLHRLRGDAGPAILDLAARAYLRGTTADERVAGARLWIAQRVPRSADVRRFVILEFGGDAIGSWVVRTLLGAPVCDADPAETRLAAAEALLAHIEIGGISGTERDAALRQAVAWIARPARVEGRQVDEEAKSLLRATLPELARDPAVRTVLVETVTRRLRAAEFDDPAHGIRLLLTVGESTALPALVSLVDPEHVQRVVLGYVSGALRDLRRTGDAETARRLVDPARPNEIRTDGTRALAGESWSLAGPFLTRLLHDSNDAVASEAATVLLARSEPEARALLEAALLDPQWRPYSQNALHTLTGPADDAAYALLDRLLRKGSVEARRGVFIEISAPTSSLRGPKAVSIVRLAMETPALEIDIGTIATALSSVDGPTAVRFIRDNFARVTRPGVLLRNLHVVAEKAALDFALEIAATLKDDDDRMLSEVAAVLSGRSATDPSRTDPFWRRLLSRGSADMRRVAVRQLTNVDHGPMSAYLVPYLADKNETAPSRKDALLALERGNEPLPENLLWFLASDRIEDEDLRSECAKALVTRASQPLREKATAWLSECVEEANTAIFRVAEMAGTEATPHRARRLVELFRAALSARFSSPPFVRPPDDEDTARSVRVQALTIAVAKTRDALSIGLLADSLVDPRFARFQWESRRFFAIEHGGGGGPLTSGADPLEIDVALRFDGATPTETPRPAWPPEAGDIVEALVRADPKNGAHRVTERLVRARDDGSLAQFDDLYVAWTARRIEAVSASDGTGSIVSADESALPSPARPDGPEAAFDRDRRSQRAEAAGRYEEAITWARASLSAGARCGVVDLPPSRWLDRGHVPQPSWSLARARIELLHGAALAAANRLDEARARFALATARQRFDPRIFLEAALLRARVKFDLEAARSDVRRAAELERRQGDEPSLDTNLIGPIVERAIGAAKTQDERK